MLNGIMGMGDGPTATHRCELDRPAVRCTPGETGAALLGQVLSAHQAFMKAGERFPEAIPITPASSPFGLAPGVPQADKIFPAPPVLNLQRTEKEPVSALQQKSAERGDMNAAAFYLQGLI